MALCRKGVHRDDGADGAALAGAGGANLVYNAAYRPQHDPNQPANYDEVADSGGGASNADSGADGADSGGGPGSAAVVAPQPPAKQSVVYVIPCETSGSAGGGYEQAVGVYAIAPATSDSSADGGYEKAVYHYDAAKADGAVYAVPLEMAESSSSVYVDDGYYEAGNPGAASDADLDNRPSLQKGIKKSKLQGSVYLGFEDDNEESLL